MWGGTWMWAALAVLVVIVVVVKSLFRKSSKTMPNMCTHNSLKSIRSGKGSLSIMNRKKNTESS